MYQSDYFYNIKCSYSLLVLIIIKLPENVVANTDYLMKKTVKKQQPIIKLYWDKHWCAIVDITTSQTAKMQTMNNIIKGLYFQR